MKVYLQADDFGLTKKITDDILECVDAGVINSVSVMVNGYAFEYAMEEFSKRKNLSISLHLNLDQAMSITRKELIPLITNEAGNIISSFEKLFLFYYSNINANKAQLKEQVRLEIISQIEMFLPYLKALNLPLQIDSERNSHMIPFVFEILIELSSIYKIEFIRIVSSPSYLLIRNRNDLMSYFGLNIIKHSLLNVISMFYGYKQKLKNKNIRFTDYVFSLIHNTCDDKKLVEKYLNLSLARNAKSIQIVFHPFKPDENEMHLWNLYPIHKIFFSRKSALNEKNYLLENKKYFNDILTKYSI